ncbi:nascent polypeptide-associated complex subunit alpha, muscle-specific form-like [Penaeus vannamei]|uniref:nascent polypeptide-associated complex subunit alpha, muscle-specific form-like n=1 Tax=Penaeus vannamei TaxID=6689 RepID=UPI00387F3D16
MAAPRGSAIRGQQPRESRRRRHDGLGRLRGREQMRITRSGGRPRSSSGGPFDPRAPNGGPFPSPLSRPRSGVARRDAAPPGPPKPRSPWPRTCSLTFRGPRDHDDYYYDDPCTTRRHDQLDKRYRKTKSGAPGRRKTRGTPPTSSWTTTSSATGSAPPRASALWGPLPSGPAALPAPPAPRRPPPGSASCRSKGGVPAPCRSRGGDPRDGRGEVVETRSCPQLAGWPPAAPVPFPSGPDYSRRTTPGIRRPQRPRQRPPLQRRRQRPRHDASSPTTAAPDPLSDRIAAPDEAPAKPADPGPPRGPGRGVCRRGRFGVPRGQQEISPKFLIHKTEGRDYLRAGASTPPPDQRAARLRPCSPPSARSTSATPTPRQTRPQELLPRRGPVYDRRATATPTPATAHRTRSVSRPGSRRAPATTQRTTRTPSYPPPQGAAPLRSSRGPVPSGGGQDGGARPPVGAARGRVRAGGAPPATLSPAPRTQPQAARNVTITGEDKPRSRPGRRRQQAALRAVRVRPTSGQDQSGHINIVKPDDQEQIATLTVNVEERPTTTRRSTRRGPRRSARRPREAGVPPREGGPVPVPLPRSAVPTAFPSPPPSSPAPETRSTTTRRPKDA